MGNMYSLKLFIELHLLKIYNIGLERNFRTILLLIDLFLPKSDFKIQKENNIQINSTSLQKQDLPIFAQEVSVVEKLPENDELSTIIFIVPNSDENLTKLTILKLAKSLDHVDNVNYIVITRFGELILSNRTCNKILSIEEIINTEPDLILFEIHTIYEKYGLINEQDFISLKRLTKTKIIGICFDIWRDFDISFIHKWESLVDNFIHMDQDSVDKYSLSPDKMIFWPFAGWVNQTIPKANKDNVIFFSGNLRPSDRRYALKHIKKISAKLKLQMYINKIDHSQSGESEFEEIYYDNLNRSQYVLGLAQKSKIATLITFRSLESIHLNCTLLQQELEGSSPLSMMFVPNEHYLPFKSLDDIEMTLSNVAQQGAKYLTIGKSGGDFMSRYYSPKLMWKYLLYKLN